MLFYGTAPGYMAHPGRSGLGRKVVLPHIRGVGRGLFWTGRPTSLPDTS
jgi:hypothetical protein